MRRAALLLLLLFASTAAPAQSARPVHVVAPGDTLYAIAARYGTTVDELRALNGLTSDLLRVGAEVRLPPGAERGYRPWLASAGDSWESLAAATGRSVATLRSANPDVPVPGPIAGRLVLIPPADGVTHRAQPGETIAGVAAAYAVDPEWLLEANGLASDAELVPGQPLLLPPGSARAEPVAGAAGPATGGEAAPGAADAPRAGSRPGTVGDTSDPRAWHRHVQQALLPEVPAMLVVLTWPDDGFAMPVDGRLSSSFGWRNISVAGNRFHGGIDLAAPAGTPVAAARGGVVTHSGWIGAYGYAVYVDHGDGSESRYAHLQRIDVRPGDRLLRGDAIGLVGSTGASTGPHLHFEIRLDGRAVDPLGYLTPP